MRQSGLAQCHSDYRLHSVTVYDVTTDDRSCVCLSASHDSNWIGDGCGVAKMVARGTRTGLVQVRVLDVKNTFRLQVEKATACANEAIANIRTVRAFAMEERELE